MRNKKYPQSPIPFLPTVDEVLVNLGLLWKVVERRILGPSYAENIFQCISDSKPSVSNALVLIHLRNSSAQQPLKFSFWTHPGESCWGVHDCAKFWLETLLWGSVTNDNCTIYKNLLAGATYCLISASSSRYLKKHWGWGRRIKWILQGRFRRWV